MTQGWEIKNLGECFEYIKNGANIKQERGAGGINDIRYQINFYRDTDKCILGTSIYVNHKV